MIQGKVTDAGLYLANETQQAGLDLYGDIQSTGLNLLSEMESVGRDLQEKLTNVGLDVLKSMAGGPAKKKAMVDTSTNTGQLELIALCALGAFAVVKLVK